MKLVRIILSIVLLLIVIAVIAFVSLVYFIDPNRLKPVIVAEVQKQSDYKLTIDGDLSWTLYPTLGISIPHITLRAPQQTTNFAELSNVTIATDLIQLLKGTQKLEGDVRIKDIRLMNLHMQSARIGMHWQNQTLTLAPVSATLYDGKLNGEIHGSNLSGQPKWDWDVDAKHVQIKPLLDDVNGPDSKIKITGTGDLSFQATATGKNKNEILSSANGPLTFALNNGSVEGIDLNYLIQTADAIANKQAISPPANFKVTQFDNFTGTLMVRNGNAQTNNLLLVSTSFITKGQGQINLMSQTIDLNLQVSSQNTTKIKGSIPISITGNVSNPTVRLDTSGIEMQLVKEQLEKAKAKVQEKLKGLPDKADKFLNKILGN